MLLPQLDKQLESLRKEFASKAKQWKKIDKVGRTHLQDAVVVSL